MTDIEKRLAEMQGAIRQIVQQVLILAWGHWIKHGTPIKREDIDLVMQDIVAMDLIRLIDDLRAENERFRKALEFIRDAPGGGPGRRVAYTVLLDKVEIPEIDPCEPST